MNAIDTLAPCPVVIGQALYASAHGLTWVASIEPESPGQFLMIGGPRPMAPVRWRIVAVTDDGRRFTMDEHTAEARALDAGDAPARDDVGDLLALASERAEQVRRDAAAQEAVTEELKDRARGDLATYRPSWAVAAIVAELREDQSDSMTDYFAHRTTRTVVIGWSRHNRDLFAEMRKAAATFPETAHLADAPDSAEHREKYSMGGGFYLKVGGRHSSGWCVKKTRADWLTVAGLEFTAGAKGDRPAKPGAVASETAPAISAGAFTIEEHTHTKKGFQMHIAIMADRVDRERYLELLDAARALGGWYSKAWAGCPAGFAFKDADKAAQFVAEQGEGNHPATPGAVGPDTERAPQRKSATGADPAKLRELADGMQSRIDDCFRDRRANTPKQSRQAAEARNEGTRWERAQRIARALADALDAGTAPAELDQRAVATKKELYDLAAEAMERNGGYYDAGVGLGRPYDWLAIRQGDKATRAALAWGLLAAPADPARAQEEELRRKVSALKFAKIEGYFPTPAALVADMLDRADLPEGAEVIEPSAGSGAIADALREAGHYVQCVERHASLAEVLRLKGHNVRQCDWMELRAPEPPSADAVFMNPPFERGQDVEHVMHAWQFVKPGGAVIAIMGAGVKYRSQRPYSAFREWLDERGGEMIDIPAGAFKESGTGVASVMVIIRRGEG